MPFAFGRQTPAAQNVMPSPHAAPGDTKVIGTHVMLLVLQTFAAETSHGASLEQVAPAAPPGAHLPFTQ